MPRIGAGGAPLASRRAARAACDMEHRAFVADEQTQQLDESRAVETAGGAVRRRLNRDRIAHAGDGEPLFPAQLGAEDRARRAPRRGMAEQPRQGEHPLHGAAGGAPPRVGEHEIGVRPPAHQPQQRFNVRRLDPRVFPHELLEFGQLHLHGGGETQALDEQFVSELREPVFHGSIEILDCLEDSERDDAVHHEARNVASPPPLRNSRRGMSLLGTAMPNTPSPDVSPPVDEKRASFEREALVHLDVLYRVALRLSGNPSDADDLVQETMLKAFRAWDQYEKGTNAKAWLLTILRHAFINEYRRRTRHPETVDLDKIEPYAVFPEVQDEDPQGAFFDRIVDDQVLRAIDQLPVVFRETLVLSDVEGMTYQEIAGILDIPVGTVKSRLFRARQLLQGRLYDYAVEMGYIKGTPA